jgi:hypothetical protein
MSFEKPWGNYLLEKIIETAAPETISLWPETIGWKLVTAGLLIYITIKCYQQWQRYQRNAYRRDAITWLNRCSLSNEAHVRQLPTLIRKVALLAYDKQHQNSRDEITISTSNMVKLSGKHWANWLDKHCDKSDFLSLVNHPSSPDLLSCLAYMPTIDFQDKKQITAIKQLHTMIGLWITHHKDADSLNTMINKASNGVANKVSDK